MSAARASGAMDPVFSAAEALPRLGQRHAQQLRRALLVEKYEGELAVEGLLALLAGEPGVGKTRLVHQFASATLEAGAPL